MCNRDTLCWPKRNGGLDIRQAEFFNEALLCKQAWRCLTKPLSLPQSLLLAKYCSQTNFLEVQAKATDPWTWKSILKGQSLDIQLWS